MHDRSVSSSAQTRAAQRRRNTLRLGTCISGAAALLLLGSAPASAAQACGPLTLATVVCPPAKAGAGTVALERAAPAPMDLTVHHRETFVPASTPPVASGIAVTSAVPTSAVPTAAGPAAVSAQVVDPALAPGDVTVEEGNVLTTDDWVRGIDTVSAGTTSITAQSVETRGNDADGIHAYGYGDISIAVDTVKTSGYHSFGISANNNVGGLDSGGIDITAGEVETSGAMSAGVWATAYGGSTNIDVGKITSTGDYSLAAYGSSYLGNTTMHLGDVTAAGQHSQGVIAISGGATTVEADTVDSSGRGITAIGTSIDIDVGSVTTHEDGNYIIGDSKAGIYAHSNFIIDNGQAPDADISIKAGSVKTEGLYADGIDVINVNPRGAINVEAGTIDTQGDLSFGVFTYNVYGDTAIKVGSVSTQGYYARGIEAIGIYGDISVTGQSVATKGDYSYGVYVRSGGGPFSGGQSVSVDLDSVSTQGFGSDGVRVISSGSQMNTDVNVGTISTSGDFAYGALVVAGGVNNDIHVAADQISTSGDLALGVQALNYGVSSDIAIDVGNVSTSGNVPAAIFAFAYDGDITINAGSVDGGGIGANSLNGTVTVNAGTIHTDHYEGIGIAVSGENVAVDVDSVEMETQFGSGIMAQASKTVTVNAGSVSTTAESGFGILAEGRDVTIDAGQISTSGDFGVGIYAASYGDHKLEVTVEQGVKTAGFLADGIFTVAGGETAIHNLGTIEVSGEKAGGIRAYSLNGVTIDGAGSVTTSGYGGAGIVTQALAGTVSVSQDSISTSGEQALGLYASLYGIDLDNNPTSGSIDIAVGSIATQGTGSTALAAVNLGTGDVAIDVGSVTTQGDGAHGIDALALDGNVSVKAGSVGTAGAYATGIYAASGTGAVSIDTGTVVTAGMASTGIAAIGFEGPVTIAADTVSTKGDYATGIYAVSGAFFGEGGGIDITTTGAVSTEGFASTGIYAAALNGDIAIHAADVSTAGDYSVGIRGFAYDGNVSVTSTGSLATHGNNSYGVLAFGAGAMSITNSGSVATQGDFAHGLYGLSGSSADSTITIDNSGSVSASGYGVNAIRAVSHGGGVDIASSGTVEATGEGATGVMAVITRAGRGGDRVEQAAAAAAGPAISLDLASVTVSGEGATGVAAFNYRGDIQLKADHVDASQGTLGVTAMSFAGNLDLEVGDVSSGGRGIFATGYAHTEVTVDGSVIAPNHVAIELASWFDEAVLNVSKGALVVGGGQHNPADDPYMGIGNAVIISGDQGATINNAGTIRNLGDRYTIYFADTLDYDMNPASQHGIVINNSGTIEGTVGLSAAADVFANSGRFVASGDSEFGGGDDVFTNTGAVIVSAGTVQARAAAAMPRSVTFRNLELFENKGGLIDLRGGAVGDTLTLTGDYVGSDNALLALDIGANAAGGLSDTLVIEGAATGSTGIVLNQTASDATLMDKSFELVRVGAGSSEDAFHLAQADVGLVHYQLVGKAGSYGLTAQAGAPVYRLAKLGEAAQAIQDQSAQAWSTHLAQLRDEASVGTSIGRRLWGQTYGSVVNRDGAASIGGTRYSLDYRQDFYGFQAGADLGGSESDNGSTVFGVTAGYLSSRQTFDAGSERASFDSVNFGAYGSIRRGIGFANLLAQYDHHAIDAHDRVADWSDKTDGNGYGVQGEIGARLGSDGLFVEPVASLAWQKTDIDALHMLGQTVDLAKIDGLTGKLSARVGGKANVLGTDAIFYARGSWVHAFDKTGTATLESAGLSETIAGRRASDYGEAALGVTILSAGPVSGFIEGNATFGSGASGGGGRAGVSFRF